MNIACSRSGAIESVASHSHNKRQIAQAFAKAKATYDRFAQVQQYTGHALLALMQATLNKKQQAIKNSAAKNSTTALLKLLDLGTGSGYFLPKLGQLVDAGHIVAGDLSWPMLEYAQKNYGHLNQLSFCHLDAERLPFASQSFDVIYSNLMVQWCQLEKVFAESKRVLKNSGVAHFSTLVAGSLQELQSAWAAVDNQQHINRFVSVQYLEQLQKKYPKLTLSYDRYTVYYSTVSTLLTAIKSVGANKIQHRSVVPFNRHALQQLAKAYDIFRQPQGLPLTYQLAYLQLDV